MRIPSPNGRIAGQVKSSMIHIFQKNVLMDFFWLNLGTFLIAAGIHFFKFPNNINTGGISGLALVVAKIEPSITPAWYMFVFNTILLFIGYAVFGRKFGIRTVYSSLMLSVMVEVLENVYPVPTPLTNLPLLELFFSVILPGVGGAIIFNIEASNGGSDILGMILKKYTNLNIGTSLGIVDIMLVTCSMPIFSAQINLLNILGLIIKASITDGVIDSLNLAKYFTIITRNPDEVCRFINQELNSSATITQSKGAYTGEERYVVLTVLHRQKALRLQHYMRQNDPEAFMCITNTSEIIGKGFRTFN